MPLPLIAAAGFAAKAVHAWSKTPQGKQLISTVIAAGAVAHASKHKDDPNRMGKYGESYKHAAEGFSENVVRPNLAQIARQYRQQRGA